MWEERTTPGFISATEYLIEISQEEPMCKNVRKVSLEMISKTICVAFLSWEISLCNGTK